MALSTPSHGLQLMLFITLVHLFSWAHAATVTYDFDIGWVTANPDGAFNRTAIGINGQWPIPQITANVSDQIIVNVKNSLGNQSTSLHFHGLYQYDPTKPPPFTCPSRRCYVYDNYPQKHNHDPLYSQAYPNRNGTTHMDGPAGVTQCDIPPGSSFTYNFTINQPGTYWYHSHVMGQYPDGLRGPLIVHDPASPFAGQYDEELVLTVSDWYHDQMADLLPGFISKNNPSGAEPVPKAALWNETQNLTIPIQPGRTYLFRLVNIGAFAGQYIWFEGHNVSIIEVDGIYTQPAVADMIYLSAAQRCSFLLTARNDTSANFPFVASMDTVSFQEAITTWIAHQG